MFTTNWRMPLASLALAAAGFAGWGPATAAGQDVQPLRLCADPANLPFSSDDPAKPGLYLEIGQALGKALGRPVTPVWYRTNFGKRAVRVTMLANQCDAMIGLPAEADFMGPRVIFSKPLFRLGYAIVAPPNFAFTDVESLRGKRVAVQFSTTPQNLLGPRDDIAAVTVLSPEEGMKALADGRADAAFIWGLTAGYLNSTTYGGKFKITSVEGPALSWPTAIGFAKQSASLRDAVDAVLPAMTSEISSILEKYGVQSPQPVIISQSETRVSAASAPPMAQVAQSAPSTTPAAPTAGAIAAPATPVVAPTADANNLTEGKELFNGTCAHCHGPDAVQSVKKIDLRRLDIRYGGDAYNMFWTTVHEGRPSKGMPPWKEVFTDDQFKKMYTFLETLQTKE
jgi:polar amino acid transport system substrate-binding protein